MQRDNAVIQICRAGESELFVCRARVRLRVQYITVRVGPGFFDQQNLTLGVSRV
jgi:hypothetical protein